MGRMTIEKIYTLPAALQQQILAFAEFVELRAKSQPKITPQGEPSTEDLNVKNTRQGFGSWKGSINIHADFDEPLADFEEYM
jgi:Protein of unknown function (DUF2281)